MEKYKDSDVELMSILLKLQEQTSPIRMSIGYTVGGTVRQGIILYEAAPKVIETLAENVALKKEVVRKPYTSSTKTSDTSYEYTIKLEEDELVGTFISEMALIDEDGDVVAFSNFLAKGKDETEVTFTIEDNY